MPRSGIAGLYGGGGGGLITKLWPTLATAWTVAHQAPLSVGCSRQGYWSGSPCPSPGDLPDPGIAPRSPVLQAGSPALQADCLPTELQGKMDHPRALFSVPRGASFRSGLHGGQPARIPTNREGGLPFLYTLSSICSL